MLFRALAQSRQSSHQPAESPAENPWSAHPQKSSRPFHEPALCKHLQTVLNPSAVGANYVQGFVVVVVTSFGVK